MYNKELKLSPNFKLVEFTASATAVKNKIDNHAHLTQSAVVKLKDLCENILQPVREHFGIPIMISSGYRCRELNKLCGGATYSQHTKGEAADIYINPQNEKGVTLWDVFEYIYNYLDFDQMIWETRVPNSKWIHVSFVKYRKNRLDAKRCWDGVHYEKINIV